MLTLPQKNYWILPYQILDGLVQDKYGVPYESAENEDWENWSRHCYHDIEPDNYTMEDWENASELYDREMLYPVGMWLWRLHVDGHLPAGNYLIEVSW